MRYMQNSVCCTSKEALNQFYHVFSCLLFYFSKGSNPWSKMVTQGKAPTNVMRWFSFLGSKDQFQKVINALPESAKQELSVCME